MRDLTQIIKAYDVRGVYPDQLDAELAHRVGAAFAQVVGASRSAGGPGAVVVGRDMRPSGPELVAAFCAGVTEQGVDVVVINPVQTTSAQTIVDTVKPSETPIVFINREPDKSVLDSYADKCCYVGADARQSGT